MLRITPKSFNKSYKPTNIHQFQPKSYSFQSAKYTDFNSRERALEDSTVYKHERETLKKLREKLGFDAKQDHEDEVKVRYLKIYLIWRYLLTNFRLLNKLNNNNIINPNHNCNLRIMKISL